MKNKFFLKSFSKVFFCIIIIKLIKSVLINYLCQYYYMNALRGR